MLKRMKITRIPKNSTPTIKNPTPIFVGGIGDICELCTDLTNLIYTENCITKTFLNSVKKHSVYKHSTYKHLLTT